MFRISIKPNSLPKFVDIIKIYKLFLCVILLLAQGSIYSQSLSGISGLFIVPDAEISANTATFGTMFINSDLITYKTHLETNQKYAYVFYASLGFLPFLELSIRTMKIDAPGEALGDRILSMKIKILEGSNYLPSLVLGVQDFYYSIKDIHTNNFHVGYVLISKNFKILNGNGIDLILGYGAKIFESTNTQLVGFFYAVKLKSFPLSFTEIFLENDSTMFNSGVKLTLYSSFSAQLGLVNMQDAFYGISYAFRL